MINLAIGSLKVLDLTQIFLGNMIFFLFFVYFQFDAFSTLFLFWIEVIFIFGFVALRILFLASYRDRFDEILKSILFCLLSIFFYGFFLITSLIIIFQISGFVSADTVIVGPRTNDIFILMYAFYEQEFWAVVAILLVQFVHFSVLFYKDFNAKPHYFVASRKLSYSVAILHGGLCFAFFAYHLTHIVGYALFCFLIVKTLYEYKERTTEFLNMKDNSNRYE